MRKDKLLLLLVLFLAYAGIFAQTPGGQMEVPSNGKISGKVVDDQGAPAEYATISLVSMRDSSIISGTITDNQGVFKMSELKLGVYILRIKGLGFETKEIKPIYLMPKGRGKGEGIEQNFGNIALGSSEIKIDDVTVVGEKSRVQYKIDKKVINPSQDIASSSGTAVEILQNTPSVNVDIDGNVTLRGSGSFTVLIDGKPTVLTGSEALQQIPANMVENIEIITNPSAKFDPEGAAGIINVVLKKKQSLGIMGLVNISAGTNDKYKGNVSLNYKTGKLGFSTSVDYRNEKRYGTGVQDEEKNYLNQFGSVDSSDYTTYQGNRDMQMKGLGFQAGIDYFINDKNTLSISGRYFDRDFESIQDAYYHEWTNPSTTNRYYLRQSESGFGGNMYNLNLDYNLKFKKPDQKLDFSFTYSNRDGVRKNDMSDYNTDANKNITDENPELIKDDETGPEDDYRLKVDFVSPLGKSGIFEAGYQMRYEIENENRVYSTLDPFMSEWVIDPEKSNNIRFTDNIQAAYSTYANKIWGFDYKLGLRGEYNNRLLEQLKSGENAEYDKYDLFPSAYITRQINKSQQIQLNYSRRVNRPNGRQLDPFKDYSVPKQIRAGNPELDPEYVDSYELNFQQQLKKSFISLETYFRRTNNLISEKSNPLNDSITYFTYENVNNDNSLGIELNANLFLNNWWRLNVSGSVYYYQVNGQNNGVDTTRESFNWNLKFDNSFSFKTGTKIQITGSYRGPSATIQGRTEGFFFSNLAVRQDFLKGKFTVTAQLQDIFGTASHKTISETRSEIESGGVLKDVEQKFSQKFTREPRVFTLSLSYRINNYKQKRNGEKTDDTEIEMDM